MSAVEDRIAELGLAIPQLVPPVAAYVPALLDDDRIWVSGQLPMVDGAMPGTGLVGEGEGLVSPEDAAAMAGASALNGIAAIKSVFEDLDRIRIVKVVGYVASAPGFTGQPAVINGASVLLGQIFGDNGTHARAAVGVAGLPLNAPVEVELVARVLG